MRGVVMWICGLLVFAVAAASATASNPYARALALEQQGKLRVALALLDEQTHLSKEATKHRTHLETAVRALDAAQIYVSLGEYAAARSALEAAAKPLDALGEAPLLTALDRREARVLRIERAPINAEARALLAKAARLATDGQHSQAAAVYAAVAALKPAASALLVGRARIGQLQQQSAAATHHTSSAGRIWSNIRTGFETAATSLAYVLAAALVIVLLLVVRSALRRRSPREAISLFVEDLTSEAAERTAKSYVLGRELLAEIRAVDAAAAGAADEIDEARDLAGGVLPNFQVVGSETPALDVLVDDTVRVGPIGFSPRQVARTLNSYFRRLSRQELIGGLVGDGARSSLTVERYENGADGHPRRRLRQTWHVVSDGDSARAKVIAAMAGRIVAAIGTSTISTSWESLVDYREAMEKLDRVPDAADEKNALEGVKGLLRRSLDRDQGNLLARFNLGRVEGQLVNYTASAAHFHQVDVAARNPKAEAGPCGKFLADHAEIRYLARCNEALALLQLPDWQSHNRAVEQVSALWNELSDEHAEHALSGSQRQRLLMLAMSAWASARAFEVEHEPPPKPGREAAAREFKRTRVEEIEDAIDVFDELGRDNSIRADRIWVRSLAATRNAYGRALASLDDGTGLDRAITAFKSAIDTTPDLAEAYVNLARTLRERRRPGWWREAEDAARTAGTLSPQSREAKLELGFALSRSPGPAEKREEAKTVLKQVEDDPWAAYRLAELLADEDAYLEAARACERSLMALERYDFRSLKLVEWTINALRQGPVDSRLLSAVQAALGRAKESGSDKDRERALVLTGNLEAALQAADKPAAPAHPPTKPPGA